MQSGLAFLNLKRMLVLILRLYSKYKSIDEYGVVHVCCLLAHIHVHVDPAIQSQFHQLPMTIISQGLPYDFESVMHYTSKASSKNGRSTLLPKDSNIPPQLLGNAQVPTTYDYLHINLLYCGGISQRM